MVNYATRRLPLTSFVFYGCHCGIGGSGLPVDEIDWCCRFHDCCYDILISLGGTPLHQAYKVSLINRTLTCDDEDPDGFARRTCECDRTASLCFQEFNDRYSRTNSFNFFRKNCWGIKPPC
ncbi:phospholipase A2-like isoform X2 [Rhinoderma darwinii]